MDKIDWRLPDPTAVTPQNPRFAEWFTGDHLHYLPSKAELRSGGFELVLAGWNPPQPLIHPHTRVLAMGSCFAQTFALWLAEHGFNRPFAASPNDALVRSGSAFENVAVIAQQFRWAFGRFNAKDSLWFAKDGQRIIANDEDRLLTRETLEQTDVLIITLGISEVWYNKTTGEPMWRAVPARLYDPTEHAFRVLSVSETVAALQEIDSIRREFLPGLKIVYTVSPIRLKATFRPISAITANSASKAILRAGLDEFLRANSDEVNRTYFYFPSYEIVTELLAEPFVADMRHLYAHVPEQLLAVFARYYTSFEADPVCALSGSSETDLRLAIAELEEQVATLQRVCDERSAVIRELDLAARERLLLIERLDAELRMSLTQAREATG